MKGEERKKRKSQGNTYYLTIIYGKSTIRAT